WQSGRKNEEGSLQEQSDSFVEISHLAEQAQSIGTSTNPGRETRGEAWWYAAILKWRAFLEDREAQVFLLLTLLIGALVGLIVVAVIEITGRLGGGDSGGVHRDDGAVGCAAVSAGCGGVEKVSGSRHRVAGDGVSAL